MNRLLACTLVVLVVTSLTGPVVTAQEDDEELTVCDDITEPGTYQITEDIHAVDGSGDASCIEIRDIEDGEVVIEGNGHAIIGNGAEGSQGIYVNNGVGAEITVRDVEIRDWSDGIRAESGDVTLQDSEVHHNSNNGVSLEHAAVHLENTELHNNEQAVWHQTATITGDNAVIRNNGAGVTVGDGGPVNFANSEFIENEDYGFEVRHRTGVQLTNVEIRGNGEGINTVSWDSTLTVDDSVIVQNAGPGIDGQESSEHEVELRNVELHSNDGREINPAMDREEPEGLLTSAENVQIGDGVTISYEMQKSAMWSYGTDWSDTDAVGFEPADDSSEFTATFEHGHERGELYEQGNGGWQKHSEYDQPDSFTVTLDEGSWTGYGMTHQQTPTPTETPTQTPTETETPTPTETSTPTETETPTDTPTPTRTPTPTDTPTPTSTPTPTQTQEPTPTDSWVGGGGGTSTETATPTERTPTETPTPTQTATSTAAPSPIASPTDNVSTPGTDTAADQPTPTDTPVEVGGFNFRLLGIGLLAILVSALVLTVLMRRPPY